MQTQTETGIESRDCVEEGRQEASPWACWVNTIPGVGGGTLLRIRGICGNSRNFCRCLYQDFSERDLLEIGRLLFREETAAQRFAMKIRKARETDPEEEVRRLRQKGVSTVCYDDADYPDRLRQIHNPPYLLYYIGTLPSNEKHSIAIIGSRMATPYGREQARIFARTLAANGIQVISGMARGIDGIAGRAALDSAGMSVAVLGGGPDQCYPIENSSLYEDLKVNGCVMSEYHPGIVPAANFFPARNRIIAALSDAVLVIEAKEKSGTMLTVDFALEQGRDIFAVPGRVCDRTSRGCNLLLRQGAGIATCPEDLLEYFFGVGQDEAVEQVRLRELREKRASMVEKREQAAFLESSGRGPGFLRQLSLEDLEEEKMEPKAGVQEKEERRGTENTDRKEGADKEGKKTAAVQVRNQFLAREEAAKKARRAAAVAGLSLLEKNVLESLDSSTARNLDELLPEIRQKQKRSVSYAELVGAMTRLAVRDLVQEVRVGYYLAL